ncbi:MAG: hypothetical protein ABW328_11350 [Ilumatobacteraceae bacterium]
MSELSRRALLRASAVGAAAVAVPMGALGASGTAGAAAPERQPDVDPERHAAISASGPVMFCVHDASKGEVSIIHGTTEVVVHDRQLVARIIDAAARRTA